MSDTLRVGVVGVGHLGSQHARNWSDYQARRAQAAAGGGANAAAGAPAGCGGPVRGHADKH